MPTYTQQFGHLCRGVTLWRPSRADSGHGTKADPTYTQVSSLTARVKERSAAEILLPSGDLDGKAAEITVDVSVGATVQANDLVRDAGHPLGLHVWRVQGIEARGEPVPRVILKCSHEVKPPQEVR